MDKKQGWVQLSPESLAALYSPNYKIQSVTVNGFKLVPKQQVIDGLLNKLDEMRDECIEQALIRSDMSQANQLIKAIMEKK